MSTNNMLPQITSFQHAASTMPFYTKILGDRGIDPNKIKTEEDFCNNVPVLTKEDIFPRYPVTDLCQNGKLDDCVSAIVSSGTSGVFSYGLLTTYDVELQKKTLDSMFDMFFDAVNNPPVIINALPMGVSFVSSYPVIPTSVRSDIVLKVIKTFTEAGKQIVIISDPHFLKKMLEEGVEEGVSWNTIDISCIIGGTGFSDSFTQYLLNLLNSGERKEQKNRIFGTMGITEIGLNIFGGTPDLISFRHIIQKKEGAVERIFGNPNLKVCPELMYFMSEKIHIEIINPDKFGVGDIVLSHLDTKLKTILIRYNTKDKGKFIDTPELEGEIGAKASLPFPIVAIFGRENSSAMDTVTPEAIKEIIFSNPIFASQITGHFIIIKTGDVNGVKIQMKKGAADVPAPNIPGVETVCIKYSDFPKDVELNYENKWKHY